MNRNSLYFELIGGASGDMIVASLLDLGLSWEGLKKDLAKLRIKGFSLKKTFVQRGHVRAVKFDVMVRANRNHSYNEILRLVRKSALEDEVKQDIYKVYRTLRDAERRVHGHRHADIAFAQLGDIDSIVDIASAVIGLKKLGVKNVFYGVVPLDHKIAPATMEMLRDKKVYFTGEGFENVTPTGMAVLSALGRQLDGGAKKVFAAGACGYGAGALDPGGVCNVLRAVEFKEARLETDEVFIVQANIDDMNPQIFGYVFDRLFEAGALDVFVEPVTMKKTRPGFLLTVLSNARELGKICTLVLQETTTSGVRFYPAQRMKLKREARTVDLAGAKVRIKVFDLPGGGRRAMPEYEDVRSLALKTGKPMVKIYEQLNKHLNVLSSEIPRKREANKERE